MPKYTYRAQLVANGNEMQGMGEAADKFELAKVIKLEGKLLLSATEIETSRFNMDKINAYLAHVDLREKILFARNMATMIQAGLPLSRALQIFLKQTQNPKFREVLRSIIDDINKGNALSTSMEKFPKIFEPV